MTSRLVDLKGDMVEHLEKVNKILLQTTARSIILYGTPYMGQFKKVVENMEKIKDRCLYLAILGQTSPSDKFFGTLTKNFEFSCLDFILK